MSDEYKQATMFGGGGDTDGGGRSRRHSAPPKRPKGRKQSKPASNASFMTYFIENASGYRVVQRIASSLASIVGETASVYKVAYAVMGGVFLVLGYVFDLAPTIDVSGSVADALINAGLVPQAMDVVLRGVVVAVSLIPTAAEFFGGAMAIEGSFFADKLVVSSILFDLWTDYKTARVAGVAIAGVLFGGFASLAAYMSILEGVSTAIFLIAASWAFEVLAISFLVAAWEIHKRQPQVRVREW